MEKKIKAVVFKLIPCCLTLQLLVISRLPTKFMLSRGCFCFAWEEDASVSDHMREGRTCHNCPLSPRNSWDKGKVRVATDDTGGRSNFSGVPLPDQRSTLHIWVAVELRLTCSQEPSAPHLGSVAVSIPSPPTSAALPILATALKVPAVPLKAPNRSHGESWC